MYVKRKLEKKIIEMLDMPEIIAIFGARQVGKTTLMRHVYDTIEKSKVFLNFEDPEIVGLFDEDIKTFARLYVENNDFVFLDEFQYSHNGGKNLKFLYDTYGKKFIISGSSSLELTVKLPSYLVGRIFILELFPFSIEEFFYYRSREEFEVAVEKATKLDPIPSTIHNNLLKLLDEFLIFGGYPRSVISKNSAEKEEVLKNLLITFLSKDVRGFFRISKEYPFNRLLKALALQVGSLINYTELSSLAGVSLKDVKSYLSILEEAYIIRLIRPYFANRRTEIVKNPKIYFLDNGLRNATIRDFREISVRVDAGALLENFVGAELIKCGFEIKFWRSKGGAEVDFVIEEQGKLIPIEVKSSVAKSPGKSLISFAKKYNPDIAFLLHRGNLSVQKRENTEFVFLPAYLVQSIKDILLA